MQNTLLMVNAGQMVKRSDDFSDSSLTDGEREERIFDRFVNGWRNAWNNRHLLRGG